MTIDHDTLFKALDGTLAPIARPQYRYPIGRWSKHLHPCALYPCRVGYHLARGPGILPHLASALYTAEPCPEHGLAELAMGRSAEPEVWPSGVAEGLAAHTHKSTRTTRVDGTSGWTDCGHGTWRPAHILDPFAGSGTTLAVATGYGHDATGIDLDPRNRELARERVGPMLFKEVEL